MKAPSTSDRREWLVVLLLTALGAALRFWSFGRLGLTHFDEGVYALAGFWAVDPKGLPGLDPSLISYAPPGFAILVGLADLFAMRLAPNPLRPSAGFARTAAAARQRWPEVVVEG